MASTLASQVGSGVVGDTDHLPEVPVALLCSSGKVRSCQEWTSTCCGVKSRCARCSTHSGGNRRVALGINCTVRVPSMEVHHRPAGRFPSTSPQGGTTATSATAGDINWSFGRRSTTKRSTKQPSTCARRWAATCHGSSAGKPAGTEEKRHRYLNHQPGQSKLKD